MSNQFFRWSLFLSFASSGMIVLKAAISMDEEGWTRVEPSEDSLQVYVSSSEGDDAFDGLSPKRPKKSLREGAALIRDGFPDHLLLKRGDVFEADPDEGKRALLGKWVSGRNAEEPVLVSYYGEEGGRPVVKLRDCFVDTDGAQRSFQAFIGLDLYKSNSDPGSAGFTSASGSAGFRFVGGGDALLIEDCRLRFTGIVVQSHHGTTGDESVRPYTNPRIRRNIVLDIWEHGSFYSKEFRPSGLFMAGVGGSYLLEENFFDHCGWSEVVPGAGASQYNHNAYIQTSMVAGGVIRGNVFARPAAHGLQARSGGVIERNLFVLCAIGVNVGYWSAPSDPEVLSFENRVTQNVVLSGRVMDEDTSDPRTAAVWGIDPGGRSIKGVVVDDCIVANSISIASNAAYVSPKKRGAVLRDCIAYAWGGREEDSVLTFDESWPDPDVDLGDYFLSTGGEDDTIAYLEWMRERPLGDMSWRFTAYAAINYIRAGFRRPGVEGYYEYPEK